MIYSFQAPILFILIVFLLTFLVVNLNGALIEPTLDFNKKSPYECGFQPFDDNIQQFDIKYYLVALLFLLFDIETIFLIPYINIINTSNLFVFYNFFFFMFVLFVGLFYEWKNNFLDWE